MTVAPGFAAVNPAIQACMAACWELAPAPEIVPLRAEALLPPLLAGPDSFAAPQPASSTPAAMPTAATRAREPCLRVFTLLVPPYEPGLRWRAVPGAVGYNIRFGIKPDRLTQTHQVWGDELGNGPTLTKELRSLNKGVPYWVAVEAFSETGVSKLSPVRPIR